jgi:hypothetical protein
MLLLSPKILEILTHQIYQEIIWLLSRGSAIIDDKSWCKNFLQMLQTIFNQIFI